MNRYSILNRSKMWEVINYLTSQENEFAIYDLVELIGIPKWEVIAYCNFLTEIGHGHKLCWVKGEVIYTPFHGPLRFAKCLSLLENLDFDHSSFEHTDKEFITALSKLALLMEMSKPSFSDPKKIIFQKICGLQQAVFEKQVIKLDFEEHSEEVIPLQLILLNNQLEFVGEAEGKSIINIPVSLIHSYTKVSSEYESLFSDKEVEEFVFELYRMEKSKLRLILKVLGNHKIPPINEKINIEAPCEFKTSFGDTIWAATVEPSQHIYEWLSDLGPNIQILDPSHFKIEFIRYCEHKLKKLA